MSITTHVQALTTALNAIDNHLASMLDHGVTPDQYKAIEPDLIALEHTINHHATIAAQTTALAERTNAAQSIGSTHLIDYLTTTFGLSKARAHHRINLAHSLYPIPKPNSGSGNGGNGGNPDGGPDGGDSGDDDSGDDDPDPEPNPDDGKGKPDDDGDKPRGPRISAEKHAIITDELARL
ncbi:HNH endonuclease, partial [Corynebacterium glutamicum]